jgi:hypothetical protein
MDFGPQFQSIQHCYIINQSFGVAETTFRKTMALQFEGACILATIHSGAFPSISKSKRLFFPCSLALYDIFQV